MRFNRFCRHVILGLCLSGPLWAPVTAYAQDADVPRPKQAVFSPESLEFFEKDVRPILVEYCFECHSSKTKEPKGGLRLDSRASILAGGDTGPAAVAGKPTESLLIDAINYGDLYQMPPKSKMPEEAIRTLTRWVELGLPWPETPDVPPPMEATGGRDLEQLKSQHWAWRPLTQPGLPEVANPQWVREPWDAFILSALSSRDLAPAPEADKAVWLRRVTFDLIGLPPTREEVEAFLADDRPGAYERVVDGLLASPRFGERWARHWLDLVRYAESRGHEFDYDIPNAHEYRDYVIRAFNLDVPYDQFMREHVAGDLLREPRRHPMEGYNESVLGTGFWFLGEWVHSPVDIRKDECDRNDNMIDVFSKTFLGLTVACARCHEHKFDAITQRDYYALAGYLLSSTYHQVRFEAIDRNRPIADQLDQLALQYRPLLGRAAADAWRETLAEADADLLSAVTGVRAWLASSERSAVTPLLERSPVEIPSSLRDAVVGAARERGAHGDRAVHWTEILLTARRQPSNPFYLPAHLMCDVPPEDRAAWTAERDAWLERVEQRQRDRRQQWRHTVPIIDYATSLTTEWLTDGFLYGSAPLRPGQLAWDRAPESPRFMTYGAARARSAWRNIGVAEGVDRESGRLGAWDRAGKILRTPTFEIDPGKVHYLVRGGGLAYAVVDSHRMVQGPLHGSLLKEFQGSDEQQVRWVTHDLTRYAGHRAHVEFHPTRDGTFEVLAVVQGDAPPPFEHASGDDWLAVRISSQLPADNEQLARVCLQTLRDVARDMESGDLSTGEFAASRAALANWLLDNMDAMGQAHAGQALRKRWTEWQQLHDEAAGRIQGKSRTAMAMCDGTPVNEYLLIRGNPRTPGEPVTRGYLEALGGADTPLPDHGSGRLELADWLANPQENPFPARVYVNRIWHHLMGRGLVASTDNFGVLGEAPTHPDLLDALAATFIRDGWSTKRMIRRIVLSSTYRMSSDATDQAAETRDPANQWWHRMPVKRLEGEAIRDAMLQVAGRLDNRMYGRSVPVHLTPFMQGRGRPNASGPVDGAGRRSLYISVRRNFLSPMMLAFDTPQPFSTVGRRSVSNVPAQALILMNDPMVVQQARRWADRTLAACGGDMTEGITQLYLDAFSRRPTEPEYAAAETFFREQGALYGLTREQAAQSPDVWADYCHVLFNVKEFVFLR